MNNESRTSEINETQLLIYGIVKPCESRRTLNMQSLNRERGMRQQIQRVKSASNIYFNRATIINMSCLRLKLSSVTLIAPPVIPDSAKHGQINVGLSKSLSSA